MSGTENRNLFRATDITAEVFLILRSTFFDGNMQPRNYPLRDKRNTQDDPFDEYVHKLLSEQLQSGTICVKAPGPLITPDFVVVCPAMCNGVSRTIMSSRSFFGSVSLSVQFRWKKPENSIATACGMTCKQPAHTLS